MADCVAIAETVGGNSDGSTLNSSPEGIETHIKVKKIFGNLTTQRFHFCAKVIEKREDFKKKSLSYQLIVSISGRPIKSLKSRAIFSE